LSRAGRSGRSRDTADGCGVAADLVEYLVVAVPDLDAVAELVPALTGLVDSGVMHLLDAVAISRDRDGQVAVTELESVPGADALADVCTAARDMLSDRDIELAALTVAPASADLLLVTEDCWAAPLAAAIARAGGHIVAGEHIPARRVQAVLAERVALSGEDS
jgi:hypothetical protein